MAQPSADEFLGKACAGCGDEGSRVHYSKKQWNARAVRRCLKCVENGVEAKICEHGRGAYDCPACIEAAEAEADEAQARFVYEKVASAVRFTCARVYFGTDLRHDVEVTFYVDSVRMKWNEGCADDPVQITFPAEKVCDFGMYHGPTGPVDEEQLVGRRILAFRKPYRRATPEREFVHFSGEVVRCDNGAVRVACDNGTVLVDELTNMNWMLEDDTVVPNHFFAFELVDDQWVAGFQPVPGISPEAQALDRVPGFDPGAAAGPRRHVAAILEGNEVIETFKHAAVRLLQGICHYPSVTAAAKSCWGNLRPRLIETSAEAIRYLEGAMLVEQGNVREAGRVLPAKNIRKVISEVISRLDTVTEGKFREMVLELEAKADAGQIACLSNGLMEHAPTIVGRDLWCDCVDKVRAENRPTPPVFCPSNATETTAAADTSEWMTASDASEKLSEKLSIDAATGKEIGTAIASYARTLYREENATNLGNRLADTLISRNPSEEAMLAEIRQAGLDRPEKPGRLNVIKRFREASVAMSRAHNARLAAEKFEEIKKLEKSIAAANGGDDMLAKLVQKRPLVLAELLPAVRREERMERRIARRKCDVCQRADPVSSLRFLLCAGCGKRRYCSEDCQKLDWFDNGHKAACALVSEFECRVTPDCHVSERDYCDWCAETFCMDCEVGRIAPCANCGRFSCGSTQEHTTGPRGPCPVVIPCDTCGDGYCGECREEHEIFEVYTCDVCKTSSCGACGETTFCDMCQNNYCWNCRAVESCADCDTEFCADCRTVLKCNNCDKMVCTKCSFGNEENGIPHMCRDCERDEKVEEHVLASAYATLTARGAAVEAGPWSFGERQALSLVVAGLPQPYLKTVLTIIGLGQAFPDGSFRVVPDLPRCGMNSVVDFGTLPVSVCDRALQCIVALAKVPVDDDDAVASFDTLADALADRVEALEAKP